MARPKGVTQEVVVARKTIKALLKLEEEFVGLLPEAIKIYKQIMKDPKVSAYDKRIIAKEIISECNLFYSNRVPKDQMKTMNDLEENIEKVVEGKENVVPFFSTKMPVTESEESSKKNGTEDK